MILSITNKKNYKEWIIYMHQPNGASKSKGPKNKRDFASMRAILVIYIKVIDSNERGKKIFDLVTFAS